MKGPVDPKPKAAPTIVKENTFQGLAFVTRRNHEPVAKNTNRKENGN